MQERNIAFIDGQNLHLGTAHENWKIDFSRFRIYLREKFHIDEAYIFLWFLDEDQNDLYKRLQKTGFIIVFREHNSNMKWKKKGNVDVDIVFEVMRRLIDEMDFDKIVLVSGDGDYIKLVKYLIEKNMLKKILFPNKQYSSLYNPIAYSLGINLSLPDIRNKIEYTQKKRCP
jgi:uncharacterized LabA/DUF88 family protein